MTRSATIASDDFNRASLGTTDWTQMNTALAGDVQIDSSIKIKGQFGTQATDQKATARWIGAGTFSNDHYSSTLVVTTPTSSSTTNTIGAIGRASGSAGTRTFYEFFVEGDPTSPITTLNKWVNGTRTILAQATGVTWAANDLIEIECEGTTIRGCKNNTVLGSGGFSFTTGSTFTVTDASISTGAPGVVVSGTAGIFGDDWKAGDMTAAAPTAALTGTATASINEADIVTGGKTIVLTLTNDTWVAAGTGPIGSTANTQALIDGIDSAQAEATGWDAVVKAGLTPADVTRTSATVATITLPAFASYNITAQETITATVPAAAVTAAGAIVASPTFTVNAITASGFVGAKSTQRGFGPNYYGAKR